MSRFASKRNQSQTDAVTVGHETTRWAGALLWICFREGGERPMRRPSLDPWRIGSRDEVGQIDATEAPPSGIVLLECSVESRCRCDEQESQVGGRRARDLKDVMIGRREPFAQEAGPLLGHARDLGPVGVVDREIPRAPVLSVDRPEPFASRSAERELLLADDVLLDDRPAFRPSRIADLQRGLEDLRGPDDLEQLRAVGLIDGKAVRQELIDVADEAEQLLRFRLTLLADRPDLFTLRIKDPVLVGHLDQLGPLADHEDVALEQTQHAVILAAPRITSPRTVGQLSCRRPSVHANLCLVALRDVGSRTLEHVAQTAKVTEPRTAGPRHLAKLARASRRK